MPYQEDTIHKILLRIKNGDYVLPAIQREFVWAERTEDRIYNLLDSIVRKYPYGSMLFWKTRPERYRKFKDEYRSDEPTYYNMVSNPQNTHKVLVLDGQQRLQSLYLAMFGTYDGKQLYFDVFSNPEREVSERRYEFEFLPDNEVKEKNGKVSDFKFGNIDQYDYFIPFQEIIHTSSPLGLARNIVDNLRDRLKDNWDNRIEELVDKNLSNVRDAFKSISNLNYFEVSEADIEELVIDDILEIFVRINSGGMQLEKSDLMFSIIALKMKSCDPWEMFQSLLRELDRKYKSFEFDKDYFIKCFLVINRLGARYEVKKLRSQKTIEQLEEKFDRIGNSIKSCMDFLINEAKIRCDGILRSYNALIPLIYWIFKQNGRPRIPRSEYETIKYFIYMSLYTRATIRYADSRIDKLVYDYWEKVDSHFPIEESIQFIKDNERSTEINEELLNLNIDLTLNILQDGVSLDPGYSGNKPERDHIFPRNLLKDHYPQDKINHFANFWFIPMSMNRNKSDKPPLEYFRRVFKCEGESLRRKLLKEKVLPRGASLDLLKMKNFEKFINARGEMILKKVMSFLRY